MNRRNLVKAGLGALGASQIYLPTTQAQTPIPSESGDGTAIVSKRSKSADFSTIEAALSYGAEDIRVLPDVYDETLTIKYPARIWGSGVIQIPAPYHGVVIASDDVEINGLTIRGDHAGLVETLGDFTGGCGVVLQARRTQLNNVKIQNTRSFGVLGSGTNVQDTQIINCRISNVASDWQQIRYTLAGVLFINGAYNNLVYGSTIEAWCQGWSAWYGASYNVLAFSDLINNYGYIPTALMRQAGQFGEWASQKSYFSAIPGTRSAAEIYGVPSAECTRNQITGCLIDGATSACIESADANIDCEYTHNTLKNFGAGRRLNPSEPTSGGGWGVAGTSQGIRTKVKDNIVYGYGTEFEYGANWLGGTDTESVGNTYVSYVENNIGAVFIPPEAVRPKIDDTFVDCGLAIRSHCQSAATIAGRYINSGTPYGNHGTLYFDQSGDTEINSPYFENCIGAIQPNNSGRITTRNLKSVNSGTVSLGSGDRLIDSDVDHADGGWCGVYMTADAQVVSTRVKSNNVPIVLQATDKALCESNYVTKRDGTATTNLPVGGATDTVRKNWTQGQVPP